MTPFELRDEPDISKTRVFALSVGEKNHDVVFVLTIPGCDRQTDRYLCSSNTMQRLHSLIAMQCHRIGKIVQLSLIYCQT